MSSSSTAQFWKVNSDEFVNEIYCVIYIKRDQFEMTI